MAKTYISHELQSAGVKAQYDEHAKRILADRQILAWILKETVEEMKGHSITKIMSCIGDEIHISKIPIRPGETNRFDDGLDETSHREESTQPEAITSLGTEDNVPGEGVITFYIRLHLHVSKKEKIKIKLLINVEAQKDQNKRYKMVTRGNLLCLTYDISAVGYGIYKQQLSRH